MACRDYEYRYERYERKPYGECSSYDDKCMVYNDLLNEIKKLDETFDITDAIRDECNIDFNTAFLDGSKFEADANKYKFVWKPTKYHQKLSDKIRIILSKYELVEMFLKLESYRLLLLQTKSQNLII